MKNTEPNTKGVPKNFFVYFLNKRSFFLVNFIVFLTAFPASYAVAVAYSQYQKIDFAVQHCKLKHALPLLAENGMIRLMYTEEDPALEKYVSFEGKNIAVITILDKLLSNTGLERVIMDDNLIVIKEKLPNAGRAKKDPVSEHNGSQDIVVKGVVSDDKGTPLSGVSIAVKESGRKTKTDSAGRYSIAADASNTLIFTSVGYQAQEVKINAQTSLNVTLKEDRQTLSEVVVIGYGTSRKSDLTGAVSSVSAADIEKTPVTTIDQSLQGRSSGVQVTSNDGSPGGGISVKIRGVGSFGDTSPLYVVDGYPISGGLSSINPSDILSMDILKDASAAAIYGNRASNGVVIITTKRGSNTGGVAISIDALTSVQSKPEKYSMLNAEQFVTAAKTVVATDNYNALAEWKANDPSFYSDKNIDWQDAFYKTGLRQQYNLAIRGGGSQLQSSFSLGYYNQAGIVRFSGFKRYNASMNLDYTPFQWLKVSTSVKYTNSNRDSRASDLASFLNLIPTMTGRPGVTQIKDANGVYGYYTLGQQATNSGQSNVYADLEQREVDNPNNNLLTTSFLEVTLLPGLKAKTNLGVNSSNASAITFNPANDRSLDAPLADYDQSVNTTFEWLWENTLTYSKTFGKHSVDVLAGVSAQDNKFRISGIGGNGSISNDVLNAAYLNQITTTTGYTESWSLASQFGRLTYKFDDKYILTGTIRRDGSSRFDEGNKWGVFPSVSAAWKVKDESFMKNVDAISDFKIRASWGKAGNQNIPLFAYQGIYVPATLNSDGTVSATDNRGYVFGVTKTYNNGVSLNELRNPNLTWETNTQTDVGLEMSFLNNKISFSADYYKRVSSDFLLNVDVPAQTGFTNAQRNVGEMENRGFEWAVQYRNDSHPFKWNVGLNGSTIKNQINNFADGLTQMYNQNQLGFRNYGGANWTQYALSRVGGTIDAFYGYRTDGIFQDRSEIDALNASAVAKYGPGSYYQVSTTSPGDRKFVDLNGDGRVTDADRTIIGNPLPKVFGGLTFDASYKQFDFSLFVYASIGNDILNYAKRNNENFDAAAGVGLQNFGTDFYYNHWTPDNHSETYPRLVAYDQNGNNRVSDAYVEDGSFARLKSFQIGYTLPSSVSKSIFMSKLRIYVSAQNLFTITNYSGLDPEIGNVGTTRGNNVNATGVDLGNYPTSKFFTFGINAGF